MLHPESDYQTYCLGQPLGESFPEDKIPLLQMRHLRQMDYLINRGSSYELTVNTFLLQLSANEGLHALRNRKDMVVLLNEEGAVTRENDRWYLLFRPTEVEQRSINDDAPLYPVYKKLLEDETNGSVCRIEILLPNLKAAALGRSRFCILDEYCKRQPGGYLAVAEKIVREGTAELFSHVPVCQYGSLSTVDVEEIESYHSIKSLLDDYIYQFDHRNQGESLQPLSVAVFGAPGSGKSFGVKQIAKSSGRFQVTTLNLSQFESSAELFASLDQALKDTGEKIPLIFFDEFDSTFNGQSRGWLKFLLAPMQDGEYTLNGKTWKIDCGVFVFGGGTVSSFHDFLPATKEQEDSFKAVKGPDFVSRLKGMLNIKGPNPTDITDRSHIIRRAMLLRDMILRKFPGIYNRETGVVNISDSLLSALLRVSEYRHGTRSIEFILGMSSLSGVDRYTPACLPLTQQLDIHLDSKDFTRK